MSENYPEELLRGLPNNECFTELKYITSAAFQFDKEPRPEDNRRELSINWYTHDDAKTILKKQYNPRKEANQFIGCATLLKSLLDRITSIYQNNSHFSYEKRLVKVQLRVEDEIYEVDNIYHGNLLIPYGLDTSTIRSIQNALATVANVIEPEIWE
jgi:hypothetical protein